MDYVYEYLQFVFPLHDGRLSLYNIFLQKHIWDPEV